MRSELKATESGSARLVFVDGLRGVAALMVVLYHFHENLFPAVESWFPPVLSAVLLKGYLGVEVFFVLSGFVIAHSIRNAEPTWSYFGRFALRRSIRLDPPLWATIALELVLIRVILGLIPDLGTPVPGWSQIVANLTYTQRLLGFGDIVPVFWSLTYEVQFYAVLVGMVVLLAVVPRKRTVTEWLFGAAFLYSLGIWMGAFPLPVRGLFIERWFQFALGIAAWAVFSNKISKSTLGALCAIPLAAVLILSPTEVRAYSTVTAVASAGLLAVVGVMGKMEVLLRGRAVQYLGRVSYSLYLIHLTIGWRFISLLKMMFGPELGPVMASAALLGGVLLSVAGAAALHALLEGPSMRFARRVRLPQRVGVGAEWEPVNAPGQRQGGATRVVA